jgi:hypothetical protein
MSVRGLLVDSSSMRFAPNCDGFSSNFSDFAAKLGVNTKTGISMVVLTGSSDFDALEGRKLDASWVLFEFFKFSFPFNCIPNSSAFFEDLKLEMTVPDSNRDPNERLFLTPFANDESV